MQSNTYRVTFAAFNSFFLAWMKSGFFTRKRLYAWFGVAAVLVFLTFWESHQTATRMVSEMNRTAAGWNIVFWLLMIVFMAIFYLLFSGIIVYGLSALLTYLIQSARFASGSNRRLQQSVDISEQGFVKHIDGAPYPAPWAAITHVVDGRHAILLFSGNNSATIVPKSAFASPTEATEFFTQANAFWTNATGGDGKDITAHF